MMDGKANIPKHFIMKCHYLKDKHKELKTLRKIITNLGFYILPNDQLNAGVKDIFRHSVQFSSVTQSSPTLCDPMNCSTPGLPVHH